MNQEEINGTEENPSVVEQPKTTSMKQKVIRMTIIVVVLGLFGVIGMSMAKKADISTIGDPAPAFELEDIDGKMRTLSEYNQDQVVVINYFATWCGPCVDEAPELEAFEQEYGDRYKLLILDLGETRDRVKKFMEKHNTTSTYLFDYNSKTAKLYGVTGQPETFVIDKKGVIREHIKGPITKMELYTLVSKYE
ncbi:TlpA family protein disulfide reductase [Bacillus sp. FJAT-18017]|uniref:TlpA family protein disulfide reductase n=1 Tax=Bacillus sp. FJAT-18017 TaxID=1705566 RepID=UPI000A476D01|nr:TlpA disulfide reductase family protein [Bacillus sp. FJAT-18017]